MQKKYTIIQGAIFLFLGKISNLVLSSLHILLIPRLLGSYNMGFYAYWLSVYFIIARILGLGGQQIMMKNIPEFRLKNNLMITTLVIKAALIKLPIFLIIIGGSLFLWTNDHLYFFIIALGGLLFSLNLLWEIVLYSFNKMGTYTLITVTRMASRIILVLTLFYIFSETGIVAGIFGASLVAFLLSFFLILKILPRKKNPLEKPFSQYFSFGFWVYMSGVVQGLITWGVPILAKLFSQNLEVVGYFGVGVQICFNISLFVFFINESILPSLVEFRLRDKNKFKESLKLAWKYSNLFLFPMLIIGYVLAKPLITFIIGEDYLPGTLIIKLFFPAVIFLAWEKFHFQILFVCGEKTKIFLTQVINLMFFLSSWLIFMRIGKIDLAPLSVAVGGLCSYLFISFHSLKIERVKLYISNLVKPVAAAGLMGYVVSLFHVQSLVQLLYVILFGIFLYGFFMVIFRGIEKKDLILFKEFISNIKEKL